MMHQPVFDSYFCFMGAARETIGVNGSCSGASVTFLLGFYQPISLN